MKETTLGSCYGSPALAERRRDLAVAWVDGDGGAEILVAIGPVPAGVDSPDGFSPETNMATGLTSPSGSVALGTIEGRLMLAWVDATSVLRIARIGAAGPGPQLTIATDVVGGVSMAAEEDRLTLVWRTTGNQLMVTESRDGVSFEPAWEISHRSPCDPGIATIEHPYHGRTVVVTAVDPESRFLTATGSFFSDLDGPGLHTGVNTEKRIAITPTDAPFGSGPGLALLYRDNDQVALWNADLDLGLYGANLHGPATQDDPAGLGWKGDLIVAYVEKTPARQLRVGSWASVFGIPKDLKDRVGKPCDPRKCTDDPRLVCVLTGHTEVKHQDAQILNARAGDIVLSPADGDGVIGTILKALNPPELFDHMGLMVRDQDEIRHCTASKSRLIDDDDYYPAKVKVDLPAPLDDLEAAVPLEGLRPDLVKFGWPGPITQSIQNAFFDGWNDGRNPSCDYHGLTSATTPSQVEALTEDQRRAFYDKEFPEKPFKIKNITYAPTRRPDHPDPIHLLVVRPSVEAEAQFPWVRWALGRVVAEANKTTGHYRFFAYTDARIGLDPNHFAPPPGDPSWAVLPPGADWAAGTPGIVCSTFVWLAATRALSGLSPQLLLDHDSHSPEDGTAREQVGAPKIDGLYAFFEPERAAAAAGLHGWIVNKVGESVRERIEKLPIVSRVGASPALRTLADLLTGMPERVANGVTNAFAIDRPDLTDVEDEAWKVPGAGLTVSPDNIGAFWDSPAERSGGEVRSGLWGTAMRAKFLGPHPELVETGTLQLSVGVCRVRGLVVFRGQSLPGAEAFVGCRKAVTDSKGWFRLDVPASKADQLQPVRVQADWEDPPGMLTKTLRTSLPPGEVNLPTIELDPPPEWRRRIEVHGELTMTFVPTIGESHPDHHPFFKSVFVQADAGVIKAAQDIGIATSSAEVEESTGTYNGHRAHFKGTLRVLHSALDHKPGVPPRPPGAPDLSIVLDWIFEILEDDEQDDSQSGTLVILPGQSIDLTRNLHDGEWPHNTARCQITIENLTNPA
ncbi:MAG TPA: hypothetical protein VF085_01060 [Solirubrobacterales bacterium]